MSDYIGFTIKYETPFDAITVRTVAESLVQAVAENWSQHGGPEDAMPLRPAELQSWLEDAVPEKMNRVPEELTDEEIELFSEPFDFLFSPFSTWGAALDVHKNKDSSLGLGLSVNSRVQYYDPEPRLGQDAQVHWLTNRECLQHIFESLRGVLPVRAALIAPEIAG